MFLDFIINIYLLCYVFLSELVNGEMTVSELTQSTNDNEETDMSSGFVKSLKTERNRIKDI